MEIVRSKSGSPIEEDFSSGSGTPVVIDHTAGAGAAFYIDDAGNIQQIGGAVTQDVGRCDFRLTLTSGTPFTTSDVTAAETLYCAPCGGNRIALYDGSAWHIRSSAEMSIDIPDVTGVHDVFVYDSSGTPTLEVLVWTDATTRATALTTQDGVLVKNGDATRRYLGTFYSTTAGNGQTEDSFANRYLWNYYHRAARPMRAVDSTNTWDYTTATLRQANANASNQLNFVVGISENSVSANVIASAFNTSSQDISVGIGLDATNANVSGVICSNVRTISGANAPNSPSAMWVGFPGIGKHYLAWLEQSVAAGTTTWYGDNNTPSITQSGIHGTLIG